MFKNKNKAFSLIEVLIVMMIASVAFVSFYSVSTVGTKYLIDSKNRLAAVSLANEKMEIARNLKYSDVGIFGGIPNGNIAQNEDVVSNGRAFHVYTIIKHDDDVFDGEGLDDAIPSDYKAVKIVVSWADSSGTTQHVDSISRFVPPGLETSEGGAPLAINVKGSDGVGVSQATVHITNNDITPAVDFDINTDNDGHLMIPAAEASIGGYQISISKNGHETVATADPALFSYTPAYRHADVLLGVLNVYDYIQDELSSLTIKTLDYSDNPVGNLSYHISGGKIIGTNVDESDVLSMPDQIDSTDASGGKSYASISPGNYSVVMAPDAQYEFMEFEPSATSFALVPGTSGTYILRVADKTADSIIVKVVDSVSSNPMEGALVTLTDSSSTDIFAAKPTSVSGIVSYPNDSETLSPDSYTLKVEFPGYATETRTVNVNNLTIENVSLVQE